MARNLITWEGNSSPVETRSLRVEIPPQHPASSAWTETPSQVIALSFLFNWLASQSQGYALKTCQLVLEQISCCLHMTSSCGSVLGAKPQKQLCHKVFPFLKDTHVFTMHSLPVLNITFTQYTLTPGYMVPSGSFVHTAERNLGRGVREKQW